MSNIDNGSALIDLPARSRASSLSLAPDFSSSLAIPGEEKTIIQSETVVSDDNSNDDCGSTSGVGDGCIKLQGRVVEVTVGPHHFDLLKLVGEGAFGKVILVRNMLNQKYYAMKVISKKILKKKNNIQYMKSERDILTKIVHPFIVTLWFAFQTESKLFLVMDFLQGGELFFHLKRRGLIIEKDARFYFGEMILAIEFLHSQGIIHRDLKPENVLLRGDGHVCITDFGLAKEIGDVEKVRTLCGTSEYMAPEMIARNGYSKAVDWWSLGALFFEMLTGNPPFQAKNGNQKELDKKILTEKFVSPSYLTANAVLLLKGLLEKDATKRLGAAKGNMFNIGGVSALKQHCFFDGFNWAALAKLELVPPDVLSYDNSVAGSSKDSNIKPVDVNDPTRHFHEGFTGQNISLSVIDDSLSAISTPTGARSRANSDGDNALGDYEGFEYCGMKIEVTEEELQMYEEKIKQKAIKSNKKKNFKLKKESEKLEKIKNDEKTTKERKLVEESKISQEKQRNERISTLTKQCEEKSAYIAEVRKVLRVFDYENDLYLASFDKIQKKIKASKKKLREIDDLQEKIDHAEKSGETLKLTSDQKEKLAKRQILRDDVMELLEEGDRVEATKPIAPGEDMAGLLLKEEASLSEVSARLHAAEKERAAAAAAAVVLSAVAIPPASSPAVAVSPPASPSTSIPLPPPAQLVLEPAIAPTVPIAIATPGPHPATPAVSPSPPLLATPALVTPMPVVRPSWGGNKPINLIATAHSPGLLSSGASSIDSALLCHSGEDEWATVSSTKRRPSPSVTPPLPPSALSPSAREWKPTLAAMGAGAAPSAPAPLASATAAAMGAWGKKPGSAVVAEAAAMPPPLLIRKDICRW